MGIRHTRRPRSGGRAGVREETASSGAWGDRADDQERIRPAGGSDQSRPAWSLTDPGRRDTMQIQKVLPMNGQPRSFLVKDDRKTFSGFGRSFFYVVDIRQDDKHQHEQR